MAIIQDTDILEWRRGQLVKSGYPYDWAHSLAVDGSVDLHVACDLVVSAGPELAWQILRGQDEPRSKALVPLVDRIGEYTNPTPKDPWPDT